MTKKDWTGNKTSVFKNLASSNHTEEDRHKQDYYATEPRALELLLDVETFSQNIWEPACGEGHLSKVLESRGYNVRSTDLVYRNYGEGDVDFFWFDNVSWNGDIITNPPYRMAQEFVEKALQIIPIGNKVAMFLKIQFLETTARRNLFKTNPPQKVYVSSSRLECALNGDFKGESAVCYCWFIWKKGFKGDTVIKWFN